MTEITCPVCGNRGEANDGGVFAVRGEYRGYRIRKCRQCHSGLALRTIGRPRVIPKALWGELEARWAQRSEGAGGELR